MTKEISKSSVQARQAIQVRAEAPLSPWPMIAAWSPARNARIAMGEGVHFTSGRRVSRPCQVRAGNESADNSKLPPCRRSTVEKGAAGEGKAKKSDSGRNNTHHPVFGLSPTCQCPQSERRIKQSMDRLAPGCFVSQSWVVWLGKVSVGKIEKGRPGT